MAGYSLSLVEANKTASTKHLGVALGRVCIKAEISVTYVADKFGVSRMSIYNWFKGERVPHANHHSQIREYINMLKARAT